MFRVEHNVPDVYIQESRDFQLLARLYDLVFQSSRFSINSMEDVSSSKYCNECLLDLTKTKVGFFSSTEVDERALRYVLITYPYIMRCKGTTRAVQLVINLFQRLTLSAIEGFELDVDDKVIRIILSKPITYLTLLQDILEEVVPAGFILDFSIRTEVVLDDEGYVLQDDVKVVTPDKGFANTNVVGSISTPKPFTEVSSAQIVSFDSFETEHTPFDKENEI